MMEQCWFRLNKMTVGYNRQPLIRDIGVSVERGQIVTLIGPNGAGKSTILKSITRQIPLLGGSVILDERDMKTYSFGDLAKRMAVMLTDRPRTQLLTCRDVAAAGRYPYTGRFGLLRPEDEEKVDEALRTVGAEDIAGKDFARVSDGQRQRVLLARALCQEPELLILDEPTSYLDVKHKLELLAILRDMARRNGMTVILSLHEIDLAMKISDRIWCVKGDYLAAEGTPEEIFREEQIRALFAIGEGSFDPWFGSLELPAPKGPAQVLVVSAGGSGIPVYRRLAREGIPFAAGILYENDVDHRLAGRLACEVITEEAFGPVREETLARAKAAAGAVRLILDAGLPAGSKNSRIRELLEEAERLGRLRDVSGGPEALEKALRELAGDSAE